MRPASVLASRLARSAGGRRRGVGNTASRGSRDPGSTAPELAMRRRRIVLHGPTQSVNPEHMTGGSSGGARRLWLPASSRLHKFHGGAIRRPHIAAVCWGSTPPGVVHRWDRSPLVESSGSAVRMLPPDQCETAPRSSMCCRATSPVHTSIGRSRRPFVGRSAPARWCVDSRPRVLQGAVHWIVAPREAQPGHRWARSRRVGSAPAYD
jgi:hypothetical protein